MDVEKLGVVSLDVHTDLGELRENKKKLRDIKYHYEGRPLASDPRKRTEVFTFHITDENLQIDKQKLEDAKNLTHGNNNVGLIIRCHYTNRFLSAGPNADGTVFAGIVNRFVEAGIEIRKINATVCSLGRFENQHLEKIKDTIRLPHENDGRPNGFSTYTTFVHFEGDGSRNIS